jgi:cobalt-zinc-cadmium efflux system outer membrane protein
MFRGSAGAQSKKNEFDNVQQTITERTGKRVEWNRGAEADAQVEHNVEALLKRPLTADAAVQIALLNSRTLQATYEDLGIAQADLVEGRLLKNPTFTAEVRFPGRPKLPLEFDVAKEFIELLLLPMRKRVARAQFEAARGRVVHEVLKHAGEVREAFYEHQGDEQILEMRESVMAATSASAEASRRIHEAGNMTNLALANELALHERAKLDLSQAEADAIASREKLSGLMGVWGTQTKWKIARRLPELPAGDGSIAGLESIAVGQRMDLAAQRSELEAQARGFGFARLEAIFPEIDLTGHYEREPEGKSTLGPSIDIPLPIFNQGGAAVQRARAKMRQAEQRYMSDAVQIRSEVRAARDRMLVARNRASYYRTTLLPLRHRITEETQLHYNAMQLGVADLLRAKQEEIDAGREYIEALRDYWIARAQLEKAIGGRLGSSSSSKSFSSSSSSSKRIVHDAQEQGGEQKQGRGRVGED